MSATGSSEAIPGVVPSTSGVDVGSALGTLVGTGVFSSPVAIALSTAGVIAALSTEGTLAVLSTAGAFNDSLFCIANCRHNNVVC